MEITNGPIHAYGDLENLLSAPGQGQSSSVLVPDPNQDAGPSVFFQATGLPDIRYFFPKDKDAGYTGVVASHFGLPLVQSAECIPAALLVNNVCGAQAVVNGTAMAFAAATTGITPNIPIIPFAGFGGLNSGAVVTTGVALDFGFAFGNVTAGNAQIGVADSTLFRVGMPLVVAGVGNAAGTVPLLTNVLSIDTALLITLANTPLASINPTPIGTGNLWGPSENGFPTPTAALPYLARGPGLFFDPQQGLARNLSITGTGGGNAGGNFLVTAYDPYGMLWTQLVTVAAGASVGFTKKCAKYVVSVVPQFSDGVNTYEVGTGDVFEFCCKASLWEQTNDTCWNGVTIPTSVGFIAPDTTSPATNLTGSVRGVIQMSTNGGAGTPITAQAASNGTVVNLAMSGIRLSLVQDMSINNIARGTATDTRSIYGVTQS